MIALQQVLHRLRTAARRFKRTRPVPLMVHQCARVGSTSVWKELQRVYQAGPVYHTHAFAEFDAMEKVVRETMTDPSESLAEIDKCRQLRESFDGWTGPPWKIVTLVRDPVARSLSLLFRSADAFIPDFANKARASSVPIAYLNEIYRTHFANDPSDWFDRHIREVFGVDVFAEPFPKDRGYHIYRANNADILLIRMESLNDRWTEAARAFLGIRNSAIAKLNVGPEGVDSIRSALIQPDIIENLYQTRFVRHFYTDQEIARWEHKWLQARAA